MSKPEDISQEVWEQAINATQSFDGPTSQCTEVCEIVARAILAAKGEERSAIQALMAREAPHSPRRYIYDTTADRRIWACDQLDAAIRKRGEA